MTTAELKKSLVKEIELIDDPEMLEMLQIALGNINAPAPKLSEWQLKEIEASEKEIEEGKVISKEDADKKIVEWLKKLP